MKLNAEQCLMMLVSGYKASFEDDVYDVVREMNLLCGDNVFDYDLDKDQIILTEMSKSLPHIRFEYDLEHFGGDYSGVGKLMFIPESVILLFVLGLREYQVEEFENGVKRAFEAYTGIDSQHIIQYSDDWFCHDGTEWIESNGYDIGEFNDN